MLDMFTNIVSVTGYAVEGIGVVIIVAGSVLATFRSLGRGSNKQGDDKFREYRRDIGRAMMLGLEFLVAGDIIRTVVVTHSIESIATLGLVVIIRTVLVFTIHLEVEGHWPWQPPHPVSNNQGGN